MALKKGNRKGTRNPELIRGVRRFGRSHQSRISQTYKKAKLGAAGKQTPKAVKVVSTVEPRFYAADDNRVKLRSSKTIHPTRLRKSITPGTIVIILAGRFRGKRVIVLKQLHPSGLLLVTGPYKINGVPLRRVNQSYVIATRTKVDVSKIDVSNINDAFFARAKVSDKSKKDAGFLDTKEKKKQKLVLHVKKLPKKIDAALKPIIAATPVLGHYLNAKFSLTKGQFPHQMKF